LSPADICRLMKVSQQFRWAVKDALPRIFNIHSKLRIFFDNPLAFRVLQSNTGAIISGSFALQFFRRCYYQSGDLDVFVPKASKNVVGEWLLSNGYRYSPRPPPVNYQEAIENVMREDISDYQYVPGVLAVLDFVRQKSGMDRKVQLIVVEETSMSTILNFHSTCVLNVITYNTAYCLYPKATLSININLL
ncbi:hypothetical protein BDY19DRAFT_863674, partial [Irpex rosettiformis]